MHVRALRLCSARQAAISRNSCEVPNVTSVIILFKWWYIMMGGLLLYEQTACEVGIVVSPSLLCPDTHFFTHTVDCEGTKEWIRSKIKDGHWDLCENKTDSQHRLLHFGIYIVFLSVFVKQELIRRSQIAFIDLTSATFKGSNIVDGGGHFWNLKEEGESKQLQYAVVKLAMSCIVD